MLNDMSSIEAYESTDKIVKFYFTHSDEKFTTGVMVIRPQSELPKHNRPLAVENLVQISGQCVMRLFRDEENFEEQVISAGDYIKIPQAQFHIHANPFDAESVTLFRAEGDITAVMKSLRESFDKII